MKGYKYVIMNDVEARKEFPIKDGDKIFISSKVRNIEHRCCDCKVLHHWKIRITKQGISMTINKLEQEVTNDK